MPSARTRAQPEHGLRLRHRALRGSRRPRKAPGALPQGHDDPELTLLIEDPDARFEPEEIFDNSVLVDVFGKLLREQEEAIDWNEVKERERWSAFPEDNEPPVPLREEKERTQDR